MHLEILILFLKIFEINAIQCYECDSNEDETCPSNQRFDKTRNAVVDCNTDEAHVPGTYCVKITQESAGCLYTGTGGRKLHDGVDQNQTQVRYNIVNLSIKQELHGAVLGYIKTWEYLKKCVIVIM
ncbi:hypothetical protein A3Q56_06526 [Intoshia linei]|uniref:Protein quiver n=1 Tax=Intoshia linei TaxID=1819745 RepID=A0A177AUS8_9BILA|nr:hypothetical protein A3Q56_06526 [Intoshia linei]